MRRMAWALTMAALVVCLVASVAMAQQTTQTTQGAPYVQEAEKGSVNWQTGLITAKGIGAPPESGANQAQLRGMALRAATVIARRNLLELLKGVQIDSTTTVENFMVASDVVVAHLRGYLQNSQILDTAYMSDGSVEVTVGLRLRGGVADVILPKASEFNIQRPAPAVTEPQAPAEAAQAENATAEADPMAEAKAAVDARPVTGLVVDARGLGLRPAMSPRILDEDGREVYGTAAVKRGYAIKQGMAGYAKEPEGGAVARRAGDNPRVVKAIRVSGKAGTDVVIANAAAEDIRATNGKWKYLAQCHVVLVLD